MHGIVVFRFVPPLNPLGEDDTTCHLDSKIQQVVKIILATHL